MELIDFKIVLAKLLICKYNSSSQNTPVSHVPSREVLPASVPLHLLVVQTLRVKGRYCHPGRIENETYT